MIVGSVSGDLDPIVNLMLIGVDRREEEVRVVVDTGFNGVLTLPQETVDRLGWPFQSMEPVVMADGNACTMPRYRGIVVWKNQPRIVSAFASTFAPLLGRHLLEGNDLWIQFRRGGDIVISEITQAQTLKPTAGKPIIGVVGGMGSGKSLVAQAFAKHGGLVIAADAFGHEALEQPEILARIAERWKERVLDEHGDVDRKKMGAIVFASPVERANLELLVFPWIEQRIRAAIANAQADPKVPFVILDAAIMLEAGWNNFCSKVVYVHAPRAMRLERLAKRGWTAEDLANRESAQLPLAVKAARAHVAVDNTGSVENTHKQVDALLRLWHIL